MVPLLLICLEINGEGSTVLGEELENREDARNVISYEKAAHN